MKLDETCDFGIFAPPSSPIPTTSHPHGTKRTYTRRVKAPAVPTGGFTTRLPGPVNVTVKANPQQASISSELDRSTVDVVPDQKEANLEGPGESEALTFAYTDEELGWLEDIGHPGDIAITHPSFSLMFGDKLARAGMSVEEVTENLSLLPSDPDEYFENLHLALTYEAMNRIKEEVTAMINGTADMNSMGTNYISESEENSRSSSPIFIKTVLKGGQDGSLAAGTKIKVERDAEALTKLRTIAQVELILVKNRSGKRAPLVFKSPPTKTVQFLKIGSKNLSEVIGLQMGMYVQRSDVQGNPDSDVNYFAVLSALLQASNLPPSIMKDQKCRIETHFTSEPIGSPEWTSPPNKRSRKKLQLTTMPKEEDQDVHILEDCPAVLPPLPDTNSITTEIIGDGITLPESYDSKFYEDISSSECSDSKLSEDISTVCDQSDSKRSDDASFEMDCMPHLCRVEDLLNLEAHATDH